MTADDLIRDHIAKLGVTRCPAAYAAPSSAVIAEADRAVHQARGDVVGEQWSARRSFGWTRDRQVRRGGEVAK